MNIYKRIFDISFSIFAILFLLLPIIILSVLIKLDSKGKIIFYSQRVGRDNKIFNMPKFRSMHTDTKEIETELFQQNSKITKVGSFMRRYSLDEILQFFSVIKGEMSIVGPRPCLPTQIDLINMRNKYGISNLVPGITGLAQINGRDMLNLKEKVFYEQKYLNKKSLFLDIKIILLTIIKIFWKKNDVKH